MIDLNGTLLFQFVNFFILVAILAKFAYKPILKVLEDRRNKIATDISSAEEARATAEKLKADYEAQLQKAHTEAQAIVDKAVKQADKEAQAQLDAIRAQIAREKEIAQAEIVNEVVTLSMAVAEKLLQKNMDTDMNQKLVAECLKSFDKQAAAGKQG